MNNPVLWRLVKRPSGPQVATSAAAIAAKRQARAQARAFFDEPRVAKAHAKFEATLRADAVRLGCRAKVFAGGPGSGSELRDTGTCAKVAKDMANVKERRRFPHDLPASEVRRVRYTRPVSPHTREAYLAYSAKLDAAFAALPKRKA